MPSIGKHLIASKAKFDHIQEELKKSISDMLAYFGIK